MILQIPKIVVLDSSSLIELSGDFWHSEASRRTKARTFLKQIEESGVFIALTITHILELIRHNDDRLVRNRFDFLRCIPLVAWVRPYDRAWFPGSVLDLLCREIHAVVHGDAETWNDIVLEVRPQLWETGMGSEIVPDSCDPDWLPVRYMADRQQKDEMYIESVARIDPANLFDVRLCDVLRLPARPREDRGEYLRRFSRVMEYQLQVHGDKRLMRTQEMAVEFASDTIGEVEKVDDMGGDLTQRILESFDVPIGLLYPEMTIGEIGALAVYIKRIKILGRKLEPPLNLTVEELPPESLPSYVLQELLSTIQRKAQRVSGSDTGDRNIVPLLFYADAVQVDKRTNEYLKQVRRQNPELASLMGSFFRAREYVEIPDMLENLLSRDTR